MRGRRVAGVATPMRRRRRRRGGALGGGGCAGASRGEVTEAWRGGGVWSAACPAPPPDLGGSRAIWHLPRSERWGPRIQDHRVEPFVQVLEIEQLTVVAPPWIGFSFCEVSKEAT